MNQGPLRIMKSCDWSCGQPLSDGKETFNSRKNPRGIRNTKMEPQTPVPSAGIIIKRTVKFLKYFYRSSQGLVFMNQYWRLYGRLKYLLPIGSPYDIEFHYSSEIRVVNPHKRAHCMCYLSNHRLML